MCLIGRVPWNAAVTNLLPPYVLRLDHAQPPSTSAPKVGACRFLRPRWTRYHPASPAATAPKLCSTFAVCVSILIFASACAVVLLPSIFPPHESFCWCVRITVPERLCQIVRRLALPFFSGLNSRIVQAVRRIVTTATRNLKTRHEILERISDCGRYAALLRTLSGTGATRRPWSPSQPLDAGQQGIANRTRAGLPRQ